MNLDKDANGNQVIDYLVMDWTSPEHHFGKRYAVWNCDGKTLLGLVHSDNQIPSQVKASGYRIKKLIHFPNEWSDSVHVPSSIEIKTVTSLSGGKSSGYMWLHNPTDHCVFSLVLTEDPETAPRDPGLLREVQRRIPGFIGTTELELTLKKLLLLEETAGKPIDWVCAYEGSYKDAAMNSLDGDWLPKPLTFERLCGQACKAALPDKTKRFCTETLKVAAIFWHVYLHIYESPDDVVLMNIGYRADEMHRWLKLQQCKNNTMRFPDRCPIDAKDKRNKHQWRTHEFRVPQCPMIEGHVDHLDVMKYWLQQGWQWPLVSNCAMCFYHSDRELNHNYDSSLQGKAVIDWGIQMEQLTRARFDSNSSLVQRITAPNETLFPEGQFACFCTD